MPGWEQPQLPVELGWAGAERGHTAPLMLELLC